MSVNHEFIDDFILVAENDYEEYKYLKEIYNKHTAKELASILKSVNEEELMYLTDKASSEFMKLFIRRLMLNQSVNTWEFLAEEIQKRWSE